MKAIVFDRYGDIDVLQYRELSKPIAKPDQLLVQVHASSINPVDWKIRQGHLQLLSGFNFPRIVGSDISGVVVEVGLDVTKFKPGDSDCRSHLQPRRSSSSPHLQRNGAGCRQNCD